LNQSFERTLKVKRLVHYRNGIMMADTLGGRYIAVKPHLVEELRHSRLQRLLQNAGGRKAPTLLANEFKDGGSLIF
jgi:hypothetical protein